MYKYEEERNKIFTEEGQRLFLSIRDRTFSLINIAGAARMSEIMKTHAGSSWEMLACVDRLVELGEIREITQKDCAGQHRVFVKKGT